MDDGRLCGMISRRDLRKILRPHQDMPGEGFHAPPGCDRLPGARKEVRRLMVEHIAGSRSLIKAVLAGISPVPAQPLPPGSEGQGHGSAAEHRSRRTALSS